MPNKTLLHSITDDGVSFTRTSTEDKLWAALHAHQGATCTELATAAGIGRSTASKILARWAVDNRVVKTATPPSGGAGRAPERWTLLDPAGPSTDPAPADTGPASTAPVQVPNTDQQDDGEPTQEPAQGDEAPPADQDGTADLDRQPGDADAEPAPAVDQPDADADANAPAHVPEPGQPTAARAAGVRRRRLPAGGLRGMVEDYLRARPEGAFGPSKIGKDLTCSSGAVANALVKLVEAGCAVVTQDRPRRYALAPSETVASSTTPDADHADADE